MSARILLQLRNRMEELRTEVFDNPPSDWTGFCAMVARYQEVKDTVQLVLKDMKGNEDDDEVQGDVARR